MSGILFIANLMLPDSIYLIFEMCLCWFFFAVSISITLKNSSNEYFSNISSSCYESKINRFFFILSMFNNIYRRKSYS